jgi:hypothetical protein
MCTSKGASKQTACKKTGTHLPPRRRASRAPPRPSRHTLQRSTAASDVLLFFFRTSTASKASKGRAPLSPATLTRAAVYPAPRFVTVIALRRPAVVNAATAAAPLPSPLIVTAGADRYPDPATQRHRRQYTYFCTKKASKASTNTDTCRRRLARLHAHRRKKGEKKKFASHFRVPVSTCRRQLDRLYAHRGKEKVVCCRHCRRGRFALQLESHPFVTYKKYKY